MTAVLFDSRTYTGTLECQDWDLGDGGATGLEPWVSDWADLHGPNPGDIIDAPAPLGLEGFNPSLDLPAYRGGSIFSIIAKDVTIPNGGDGTVTTVGLNSFAPGDTGVFFHVAAGLKYPGGAIQVTPRLVLGMTSPVVMGASEDSGKGVTLESWAADHTDQVVVFRDPPPDPGNITTPPLHLRVICKRTPRIGLDFTVEVWDRALESLPDGDLVTLPGFGPVYSRTGHVFDDAATASEIAGDPVPYLFLYARTGGHVGIDFWVVQLPDPSVASGISAGAPQGGVMRR